MKKIIIGNWKMNKTFSETSEFIEELKELYIENWTKIPDIDFAIAAPYIYLFRFPSSGGNIQWAAQDVSMYDNGAKTGEISAQMLKDMSVKYTIVGHSERREFFNETDEIVNKKVKQLLKEGIPPVVCIGETLEQFEKGRTEEVLTSQIQKSLEGVDFYNVIIAYEPIWAIGTGKSATPEQAQKVCKFIKEITNNQARVLYGGSVNPSNIAELMAQESIDGALVGGASLDVNTFLKILTMNK